MKHSKKHSKKCSKKTMKKYSKKQMKKQKKSMKHRFGKDCDSSKPKWYEESRFPKRYMCDTASGLYKAIPGYTKSKQVDCNPYEFFYELTRGIPNYEDAFSCTAKGTWKKESRSTYVQILNDIMTNYEDHFFNVINQRGGLDSIKDLPNGVDLSQIVGKYNEIARRKGMSVSSIPMVQPTIQRPVIPQISIPTIPKIQIPAIPPVINKVFVDSMINEVRNVNDLVELFKLAVQNENDVHKIKDRMTKIINKYNQMTNPFNGNPFEEISVSVDQSNPFDMFTTKPSSPKIPSPKFSPKSSPKMFPSPKSSPKSSPILPVVEDGYESDE